jgi:hypothetical protein
MSRSPITNPERGDVLLTLPARPYMRAQWAAYLVDEVDAAGVRLHDGTAQRVVWPMATWQVAATVGIVRAHP